MSSFHWSAISTRHDLFIAQAAWNREKSSFPQHQVTGSSSVTSSDWGAHWGRAILTLAQSLLRKTGPVAFLCGSLCLRNIHEGKWLCVLKWSSWSQELGHVLWKRRAFALAHWISVGTVHRSRRTHTVCASDSAPPEKCTLEQEESRGLADNL